MSDNYVKLLEPHVPDIRKSVALITRYFNGEDVPVQAGSDFAFTLWKNGNAPIREAPELLSWMLLSPQTRTFIGLAKRPDTPTVLPGIFLGF